MLLLVEVILISSNTVLCDIKAELLVGLDPTPAGTHSEVEGKQFM